MINDEDNRNDSEYYLTSDLKIQAFLRLMLPEAYIGLNTSNHKKIHFVFKKSKDLAELISGYVSGKKYLFSPLAFANHIDQGKALVFGDY